MTELSLEIINIIAYSKILLLATFVVLLVLAIYFKKKVWLFSLLAGISASIFYYILAEPLNKMLWGNNGDEIFIISFLSQVLQGNPFNDFYYHGLPNFYPPLYFWVTGFVSRLFTTNAIVAAKIGVFCSLFLWFVGFYLWQKVYQLYISNRESEIGKNKWLWFLYPLILFFLIDFNDIILKPYEVLPALFLVFLLGMISESFSLEKWSLKHYLFFGISGGILFLSYYFWWFVAIPALFAIALFSNRKLKSLVRVCGLGVVMFLVSAIYIVPLFLSYLGGMENWQALFFVPKDFSTFIPFASLFSWRALLIVVGIIGLIAFYKKKIIQSTILVLIFCYVYQFSNILLYISGGNPAQSAKPFLFLGSATIALGGGYFIIYLWKKYIFELSAQKRKLIII